MNSKLLEQKQICNNCGFSTNDTTLFDANYCIKCGKPSIVWQNEINPIFSRLPMSKELSKCVQLFIKCEYESSARTALVILEDIVRKKTKIESYGSDLFTKAFNYKIDQTTNVIIDFPAIRINKLISDEDKNEHEGIKLLFLGMIRGVRNIIAHHSNDFSPNTCLQILFTCDLLIDIINDGSILNQRFCEWEKV